MVLRKHSFIIQEMTVSSLLSHASHITLLEDACLTQLLAALASLMAVALIKDLEMLEHSAVRMVWSLTILVKVVLVSETAN